MGGVDTGSDVRVVVAVDGPGGSGKSTVSRAVATALGLRYLDTGAMYRALTWVALEHRVDLEDAEALTQLAERTAITACTDPKRPSVAVDGTVVAAPIRTRAVTNAVSAVAGVPGVRARLVVEQRAIIDAAQAAGGVVVEGRDIGTVVAPDAPVKVFLTASTHARARRRSRQLGENAADDVARTEVELDRRDGLDSGRVESPLTRAADAFVLDSTELGVDDVVQTVLDRCRAVLGAAGAKRAQNGGQPPGPAAVGPVDGYGGPS